MHYSCWYFSSFFGYNKRGTHFKPQLSVRALHYALLRVHKCQVVFIVLSGGANSIQQEFGHEFRIFEHCIVGNTGTTTFDADILTLLCSTHCLQDNLLIS